MDMIERKIRKSIELIRELPIALMTQVLIIAVDLLDLLLQAFTQEASANSGVLIEAGPRGWDSILFEELLTSAEEFFGSENVIRLISFPNEDRLKQLAIATQSKKVRMMIYDPRTNFNNSICDLYDALRIFVYCRLQGIKVISYLTDPSVTLWRLQSVIASKSEGIIITPMSNKELGWLAWRVKLYGPLPMPISRKTLINLQNQFSESMMTFHGFKNFVFRGSLYPPRIAFFRELNQALKERGSSIRIITQSKDEISILATDYWKGLIDNAVCITTTFQEVADGIHANRLSINQMVFRISEALAAGNLLFSASCPGIEKFFQKGEHFVEYTDERDLADKMIFYSSNIDKASRIRLLGNKQMSKIISEQYFWKEITKNTY